MSKRRSPRALGRSREDADIGRSLYRELSRPGEGILGADEIAEIVTYQRIDGAVVHFSIPVAVFEECLSGLAEAGRTALGGGGSDLDNAMRWLNFLMMEKANDMSPGGRRGYRLAEDGWVLPWD